MTTPLINNNGIAGPKDLSDMTAEQLRTFLNSFDVVFSDCDGVLWVLDTPIPGTVDSLKRLQDLGKKVYLVSNNATRYFERFEQKVRSAGLALKPEQVVLPSAVAGWYLNKINFSGEAFVVASHPFRDALTKWGIKMSPEDRPPIFDDDVNRSLDSATTIDAINAVIFDTDMRCNFSKLVYMIQCLKNKDVLFLVGSQSEWVVVSREKKTIGAGALVKMISHYSGRKPIGCGKPGDILKDYLLELCQVDPKRCLFIGDSVMTDMVFANKCGFQKLFVGTGVDPLETALQNTQAKPEYYISNLALLSEIMDSQLYQ